MIQLDEPLATTSEIVSVMNTALASLAARVAGRDLPLRHRLERAVFQIRFELADAAQTKAAVLQPEQASAEDAEHTTPNHRSSSRAT